jgi:hypothetical protein
MTRKTRSKPLLAIAEEFGLLRGPTLHPARRKQNEVFRLVANNPRDGRIKVWPPDGMASPAAAR